MSRSRHTHTHKYYRADLSFGKVWACALSDCHHYMPQHLEKMMNGKSTICWQCGEKMILHPDNLNMERPVCDSCKLGGMSEEDLPLSPVMQAFINKSTKT